MLNGVAVLLSGDARSARGLDVLPTVRLAAPGTAGFAGNRRPGVGPSIFIPADWQGRRVGPGAAAPESLRMKMMKDTASAEVVGCTNDGSREAMAEILA